MSERIEFFEGDVVEFGGVQYVLETSNTLNYPFMIMVQDSLFCFTFTKHGLIHVRHTKPVLTLIRRGPNYKPPKETKTIEFFEVVWLYPDGSSELRWLNQQCFDDFVRFGNKLIKTGQTRTVEIEVGE
jgi:hypothetical protein